MWWNGGGQRARVRAEHLQEGRHGLGCSQLRAHGFIRPPAVEIQVEHILPRWVAPGAGLQLGEVNASFGEAAQQTEEGARLIADGTDQRGLPAEPAPAHQGRARTARAAAADQEKAGYVL